MNNEESRKNPESTGCPKVVIGVLISNYKGDVLLTTARKWEGKWTCQGGHLEYGETLEDAAKREAREETNLDVTDIRLVCVQDAIFPGDYHRKSHMVFIDYSCRTANPGKLRLNHELQDFKWLKPEKALELNMNDSTRRFIQEFIKRNRGIR
jgi:ADP-ribose pyrophosphatase YjhB (NUDIX family)